MIEIFQHLGAGFAQVFVVKTFLAMVMGMVIGFAVGILPGIGGPATLALLIPFTFGMDSFQAMALLLGMITVTGTAGDITAVLFGIPGETASAATVVDGHPMAKNGEAGRALGAVLSASLIGGVFGALCLAAGIVVVRPLVLAIGYAEFFMLALAGITFMASLTGGAVVKGLAAGGIGLTLSMIGLDPVVGTQRFTFEQLFLWDGIGVLPMILGLYAIPELIDMARGGQSIAGKAAGKIGGVWHGVKDTLRYFWLVLRCSAIGTFLGLIPGLGATVASWVAYAHAAQTAREPHKIGKGAVEGVLGPGASNNATMSGALVPTIGFGVPGSPQMAILLGAFIIHGLAPGPKMLTPESQGGHLTLTFTLVAIIIVANVIVTAVSFLFLKQLARITTIRASLLIPFILLLIYIGSFAEKNAFPDLALTMVFGFIGWLMVEFGWPRPPLILGVVLGAILETNLFQAVISGGFAWLTRPSVLLIFVLIVASLLYPVLRNRFRARAEQLHLTEDAVAAPPSYWSLGFAVSVAALFVFALWESRNWPEQSRLVPWAIAVPALALALLQVGIEITGIRKTPEPERRPLFGRPIAEIWLVIFGFFAAIWLLGFVVAVPLAALVYLRRVGRVSWARSLGLMFAALAFLELVFGCVIHLPFPDGMLFAWFDAAAGTDITGAIKNVSDRLCNLLRTG